MNPDDPSEYIQRTVYALEGVGEGTVLDLTIFPFIKRWSRVGGRLARVAHAQIDAIIESLHRTFGLAVYDCTRAGYLRCLVDDILEYFSHEPTIKSSFAFAGLVWPYSSRGT